MARVVGRTGEIVLFRSAKPNVKALARRADADALVAATGFQDLMPAAGGMIDRGAQVRQEAVLALGALGPEFGIEAVKAAVRDPSDAVRVAAIRVLYAREDAISLAASLAWLPADGHTRALAVSAVGELRHADSAPAVAMALTKAPDDAPIEEEAATLLTALLDADEGSDTRGDVVEALLSALADPRERVADGAAEVLALIAPVGIDGVIAELKTGAVPHRAAAVLSRIKDGHTLEALMEGLLHRDPRVRAECAAALGELRDPAAVEALIHASRDPEHQVGAQADWALDRLGTIAVVVALSTIILEAMAAAKSRPVLQKAGTGSPDDADGERGQAPAATSPELLERLLAETDDLGSMTVGPS